MYSRLSRNVLFLSPEVLEQRDLLNGVSALLGVAAQLPVSLELGAGGSAADSMAASAASVALVTDSSLSLADVRIGASVGVIAGTDTPVALDAGTSLTAGNSAGLAPDLQGTAASGIGATLDAAVYGQPGTGSRNGLILDLHGTVASGTGTTLAAGVNSQIGASHETSATLAAGASLAVRDGMAITASVGADASLAAGNGPISSVPNPTVLVRAEDIAAAAADESEGAPETLLVPQAALATDLESVGIARDLLLQTALTDAGGGDGSDELAAPPAGPEGTDSVLPAPGPALAAAGSADSLETLVPLASDLLVDFSPAGQAAFEPAWQQFFDELQTRPWLWLVAGAAGLTAFEIVRAALESRQRVLATGVVTDVSWPPSEGM